MKDALIQAEEELYRHRTTVAGFFFNARGAQRLEKTPLGLYRSLLHQVLQQDSLAAQHLKLIYERK